MKGCGSHIGTACLGVAALALSGCTPPALRAAHSIDKGQVSIEAGATIDASTHKVQALTLTGQEDVPMRQPVQPEVMLVFGVGKGVELGIGYGVEALVKYSILDERRHQTPLSIAVAGLLSAKSGSAGLLFSSHMNLNDHLAFRPIFNAWYSERSYYVKRSIEGTNLADPNTTDAAQEFKAVMRYRGFDFPMGVELPLAAGDKWAVSPTVSFTPGIPLSIGAASASCGGCLFGLDEPKMGTTMAFYAGLRIQPRLQKHRSTPAVSKPSASTSRANPAPPAEPARESEE